jgi:hypothetical protein
MQPFSVPDIWTDLADTPPPTEQPRHAPGSLDRAIRLDD